MGDERNDGGVPPTPEPAAPPPLAAAPPPVAPPQPAPQPAPAPAYPLSAGGSKTGMWALFIILAFAAGVGSTILVLWLTGELWNSSSYYSPPPSYGSSSGSGTNSYGSSSSTTGSSTSTSTSTSGSGVAPTEMSIVGTWGENCPGSRSGAITFYSDHTAVDDERRGSWSLSGNYLTLTNENETTTLYWEMVNSDMARARRSGASEMRTISRCP